MGIERRHKKWFAYLDVPKDVRAKLGRRTFRETLKTESKTAAKQLAAIPLARWRAEIAAARGGPVTDEASYWRERLRATGIPRERWQAVQAAVEQDAHDRANGQASADITPQERRLASILQQIETRAWDIGVLDVIDPRRQMPSQSDEAQQFHAMATGAASPTDDLAEEWIKAAGGPKKTATMRRATIARLATKFPTLDKITHAAVVRWTTELQSDLKAATIRRMLSDCRAYWRYLQSVDGAPKEARPFAEIELKVRKNSWLPYSPEEGARLLQAAEAGDKQLADLIRLAMYTGARREELCALRVEHVRRGEFDIADSKTEAGVRTVPIHSKLAATVARLVKESSDGYVISGLVANVHDDRGDAIGKRFTRLKQSLGFGERHSFHSWRGTVITMLERAGVPESTTQDIVGHQRSTLTGQTYSGKSDMRMRRRAIEKLQYPSA